MSELVTGGVGDVPVDGYPLRLDRLYDPDTHMWVSGVPGGRVRIGLDALTAETYGSLAQIMVSPVGTPVGRGEPFGSLEAAKFVGPLTAPVSGVLAAVNGALLDDPELALARTLRRRVARRAGPDGLRGRTGSTARW